MERAIDVMVEATHFIVIGSSLQVYPAANLLSFCPPNTQKWIIDPKADELNYGNEFRLINQKAVDGIQSLMKELKLCLFFLLFDKKLYCTDHRGALGAEP